MRNTIYEAIIRNISKDSFPILLNERLTKTDEFDIVIIQIDLLLTESFFIIREKILYPFPLVRATHAIWRIPHYDHYWLIPLDFIRLSRFIRDRFKEPKECSLVFFLGFRLFE